MSCNCLNCIHQRTPIGVEPCDTCEPSGDGWSHWTPDTIPSDTTDNGTIRQFASGATRDTEADKLDYEGFLCPLVLERYARYMHGHRIQSDGSMRDSDNWQKGIPRRAYMKSGWRHFMDWWMCHRTGADGEILENALCALLFNVNGYLHETLKRKAINATE